MSLLTCFITVFLAVSAGFIVVPAVRRFQRRSDVKSPREEERSYGLSRLLVYSGCLIASVWSLRYAVGLYSIFYPEQSAIAPDDSMVGLNVAEELLNSFIHALQTFSMDEDYTAYIITGKTMVREIYGCGLFGQSVFGAYASLLNIVAPIAGGAVIFEILASIMPGIRLWIDCHRKKKEKCYFSELNEYSLALAKSIVAAGDNKVIIFTDAYVDDEDEKSSEELNEAKSLGAICLRDDLSHVMKNKRGPKKIFLMDKDEIGNLQTLTELANSDNNQYIKDSQIYLFVNDDAYVQIEKNICKKLRKDWNLGDKVKDEELPVDIIPVKSYRNMISNLLVDYPLYEPLIGKKSDGRRKLTVTILGTGHIGVEMFLSTYWFGQILDVQLIICMVSQEKEEDFWGKIDSVNPEIRRTTDPDDPILKKNRRGEKAQPYCTVKYMECDVRSTAFIHSLQADEDNNILDTDYYLVALGSDEENISVANTLRKYVAENQIRQAYAQQKAGETGAPGNESAAEYAETEEARKGRSSGGTGGDRSAEEAPEERTNGETGEKRSAEENGKNQESAQTGEETKKENPHLTMIAYVVYNTALAEVLNQKTGFSSCENAKIYMRAVGSLDEVYSERNVFLKEHEDSAQAIHNSYLAIQKENELKGLKNRIRDDYKYWANVARHCHVKYKMFSMGKITESWLDDELYNKETRLQKEEKVFQECREEVAQDISKMNEEERQRYMNRMHRLAWLEHRRWNAFTRVMGLRSSSAYCAYAKTSGSYKEMEIKLHPCLLECDEKGIRYRENGDGTAQKLAILTDAEGRRPEQIREMDFDLLDDLSFDLFKKGYNNYDMKQYDYPDEDFCSGMEPNCQLTTLLREDMERERKEKAKKCLRLYAVTDRKWAVGEISEQGARQNSAEKKPEQEVRKNRAEQTLEEQVRDAIDGGVTCVQLREKGVSMEELLERAIRMVKVCHDGEKKVPFIVNDNAEVAVKCHADGVHVGQNDMPISEVRRIVGTRMMIGASAHTVEEAKAAEADGADYLGVGSVFATSTKKDARPLTPETLREICRAVTIPAVAIGGITAENAMELKGSGVDGIAVVSAIFSAEDCKSAAEDLRKKADLIVGQDKEEKKESQAEDKQNENSTIHCRQRLKWWRGNSGGH